MSLRPNDKKNIFISGIFVSIILTIISLSIFMLNNENPFMSSKISVFAEVKNAQNLKTGAAVQLRGIKVGNVQEIAFKDLETLSIKIGILEEYSKWIRKDSYIAFKTQGVLGDRFLEILGGSESSPSIANNDILKVDELSTIDQFINKGEDFMKLSTNILKKLDLLLGEDGQGRISKILYNMENLTSNSNKLVTSINQKNLDKLISEMALASGNFKQSTEALNNITKQIQDGPGTMHSLIYDPSLHEDLRSLLGGANRSKVLKYLIKETVKKGEQK